jgi:methionyl-tRNA synthetase
MPTTTEILWQNLGAQETMGDISAQRINSVAQWGQLPTGSVVTKGAVLFPRLEEGEAK